MGLPEANGTGLTVTSVGNIDSQTTRAIFTLCRVILQLKEWSVTEEIHY